MYPNFSGACDQWLPSAFNVDEAKVSRNPVYAGMLSDRLSERYSGVVQGEATFVITRPTNGKIVVLDPMMWYDYDAAIEYADMRADYEARRSAIKKCDVTIAGPFDLDRYLDIGYWLDSGYTLLDADGGFLLEDYRFQEYRNDNFGAVPEGRLQTMREGQMKESARIVVPFTIDADKALALRKELTVEPVELTGCTVCFDQVTLTPLSTIVRMKFIPNTDDMTAETLSQSFALCELTDENGSPLDFSDMEGEGFGYVETEDGKDIYILDYNYGGLNSYPQEIRFVPFSPSDEDTVSQEISAARKEFAEKVFIGIE